jgi:hypothetical protein
MRKIPGWRCAHTGGTGITVETAALARGAMVFSINRPTTRLIRSEALWVEGTVKLLLKIVNGPSNSARNGECDCPAIAGQRATSMSPAR